MLIIKSAFKNFLHQASLICLTKTSLNISMGEGHWGQGNLGETSRFLEAEPLLGGRGTEKGPRAQQSTTRRQWGTVTLPTVEKTSAHQALGLLSQVSQEPGCLGTKDLARPTFQGRSPGDTPERTEGCGKPPAASPSPALVSAPSLLLGAALSPSSRRSQSSATLGVGDEICSRDRSKEEATVE